MKNLVTEEHIPNEEIHFSLRCISLRTDLYEQFIERRYVNKSKKKYLID